MSKHADITCVSNTLSLAGELDFSNVMSVYQKSLPLLSECKELIFDFSQVSASDSAGLALIIEWVKFGKRCKKPVRFQHLSADLISIAKAAGVERLIGINS